MITSSRDRSHPSSPRRRNGKALRPDHYRSMGRTLFATDLDGTLVDASAAAQESDRQALVELARRDVALTIVTGRMYANTRDVARLIGVDGPVCCVDGSAIVSVAADRHLVRRAIGVDACAALRATLG